NPGAWLFHCHIQWHLASGMALVLVEGEQQLASIVGAAVNTTVPQKTQPSTAGSGASSAGS
ncbi:hypothetical protein B0A55_13562, partial [Friedmanniomyces simplex]